MNTKLAAVGILAIVAVAIGAYIYLNQPKAPVDPWAGKNETDAGDFVYNLAGASDVYFVMDLRGANETTRTNIMQCITDLAFSSAISEKNNVIYSLDTECLRLSEAEGETPGTMQLSQCLDEIQAARGNLSKSIFYVRKSNKIQMVFDNELVIGMNENYTYMGCSISSESQQPAAIVNETIMNETWQRLTNGTIVEGNESG